MSLPVSHAEEALKIEADRPVDLWRIQLRGISTQFFFRYGSTVTWQSNTYEGLGMQLSDEGEFASEEVARPTLNVVNPAKIFGPFAAAGYFDLATITRKRVLQAHLLANANIYQQRIWLVGRVASVTDQTLALELRNTSDIPNFMLPAREFMPPEFPFVSYA